MESTFFADFRCCASYAQLERVGEAGRESRGKAMVNRMHVSYPANICGTGRSAAFDICSRSVVREYRLLRIDCGLVFA